MPEDHNAAHINHDETEDMISSEKVDGTAVFGRDGERLGTLHHFMVGKRDGKVRFAVLSFGGILGMGDHFHPLPWNVLTYDVERGGYSIGLDKELLKASPSFARGNEPSFDTEYTRIVGRYYGTDLPTL